jgi:hypothetical protein
VQQKQSDDYEWQQRRGDDRGDLRTLRRKTKNTSFKINHVLNNGADARWISRETTILSRLAI